MEEKTISRKLFEYNGLVKENDELYHGIAKTLGLSDCAFWILYFLWESPEPVTQTQVCDGLCQPKQTVNSALKKLESDGYLELYQGEDRRKKRLRLTEQGKLLAGQTVDRVMALERKAMEELPEEELDEFIRLYRKYTDILKVQMERFQMEK